MRCCKLNNIALDYSNYGLSERRVVFLERTGFQALFRLEYIFSQSERYCILSELLRSILATSLSIFLLYFIYL